MQTVTRPLLALTTFLLCAHFGSQDQSVTGREKPRINFYGTLTDTSGKSYKVENITISGMYKQVPFYQKPKDKTINPTINITRIDFAEVYSIRVPEPSTVLTFDNRQYMEVEVTSRDSQKTKDTYIIERSKRIICDQINTAGPIEKDLSFQAVDIVIFEGHKSPAPLETTEEADPKTNSISVKTAPAPKAEKTTKKP